MSTIAQTQIGTMAAANTAATPSSILGKDDFLKLLVTQLRYQDPLNPLDGTEFATQLAQFSSVEQLANINENLEASVTTNQLMARSIGNSLAASMIGRDVKASGNTVRWNGSDEVRLGYVLGESAVSATVRVYNDSGKLVRTITGTGTAPGDVHVTWDGADDGGRALPAGSYTFKVEALNDGGTALATSSFTLGSITGVRFTSAGTVFLVDGEEVPVSNILEILSGVSHG